MSSSILMMFSSLGFLVSLLKRDLLKSNAFDVISDMMGIDDLDEKYAPFAVKNLLFSAD